MDKSINTAFTRLDELCAQNGRELERAQVHKGKHQVSELLHPILVLKNRVEEMLSSIPSSIIYDPISSGNHCIIQQIM